MSGISDSSSSPRSHLPATPHADIAAAKANPSGLTPFPGISCSSDSAWSHSPAQPHARIAEDPKRNHTTRMEGGN